MDRLANWVILSWGWRRRGIAFCAGAASALAQPPFFLFPVLWLTFPVLVWLIDGADSTSRSGAGRRFRPAFATGWWFGFGYFLAGLWWVGAAFLVDAEQFGWMMPFAVLALPAGLALFWGAAAAFARLLWSGSWTRVFALAAALGGAEWLRGNVLTGFPWNAVGYALTAGEPLMQSAALFGVPGLTVLAVAVFAAPAVLAPAAGRAGRNIVLPALSVLAVAALALSGMLRLAHADRAMVPDLSIRIMQPAIDQAQKWLPENRTSVVDTYLRLSQSEARPLSAGTVLVWPESAFPFALMRHPDVLGSIADMLPRGSVLVTGAARIDDSEAGRPRYYNSIYVIDDRGTVTDAYDKVHLVPFGEYLPFQGLFEALGLEQLTKLPGGFSAGRQRRALALPSGQTFSPLICYEIIFPGKVLPAGDRPGFLLNVTNDGWFGRTIGPWQHFHQARVRAVEEGLPLIRAANTGISAVIDPYGRLLARSDLGAAEAIDAPLPAAAPPTFLERRRGWIVPLLLAGSLLIAASGIWRRSPGR
ncbi:apolipoprotein N-acyltransferase [Rhizobiales bacterium L72]|uniref:Apolipoprotein N-acyltransferase n=2 Tax=Propylenella binzhouense TaxID=2555902 RepID=A0A964T302_9HYPH|nr:apolipoprotein N-acyltransferase [Propylenella binzhouense]MYZ47430.1 apolipoprotein N-acyltransferase [Propylenella binzhouense]